MKKVYEVYVYEDRGCFVAETPTICINTNMEELQGTPVEFYDNSRNGVIQQVLKELKARGHSGVLRVM
jgi:hypothetical protein